MCFYCFKLNFKQYFKAKKSFKLKTSCNEVMPELSLIKLNSYINRATFKVAEKSVVAGDQSPGVYRRISATKDLLKEDTNVVRLRNNNNINGQQKKLTKSKSSGTTGSFRDSATRRSCAQLLAAKMAEVGDSATTGWSNNVEDYELGEVIGASTLFSIYTKSKQLSHPFDVKLPTKLTYFSHQNNSHFLII